MYLQEPLEVFTVDEQCPDVFLQPDPCPQTASSPPPTYEAVIRDRPRKKVEEEDDSGLPTYQAALRLAAQGYV
ncbi:hypothetical protein L798_01394 [Zootermopsis nevadensis]|uniref:Uncharacterized protein n=2 Tax=Zootermopsis nevadensis TaxID=136037 RepID=A0A067QJ85_ZOONE|nr:hypothetical protein L798_01394 [Zootermopsis nevadensis]